VAQNRLAVKEGVEQAIDGSKERAVQMICESRRELDGDSSFVKG
jgi:hypothetical protein